MKTPKLILSLLLCSAAALTIFAKKDPVLLSVDGKNVTVGDFKYLYNKNNAQQVEPQSLDSYLDLFVKYRLKVADALNAKVDTSASFVAEFEKYRDDLARPYIEDKKVAENLKQEAYSHRLRNITASHIMISKSNGKAYADSLREAILSGKTTFEEAAKNNSIDRSTSSRGGAMGNIQPGRYPYAFEEAAYATAVGDISEPVNSGFGWHLIRVDSSTPSLGEANAAHILRLTRGKSPEEAAQAKVLIDSIYQVVKAGGDFSDLAKRFSEDPGSGAKGGDLGWFPQGVMVQPFDSIAFALQPGEISEPFLTPFGYHIIYKKDARPVKNYDEMKESIEAEMSRDYRAGLPLKAALSGWAKRTRSLVLPGALEAIYATIDEDTTASFSPATAARISEAKIPVYNVAGKQVTAAEIFSKNSLPTGIDKGDAKNFVEQIVNNAFEKDLFAIAVANLEEDNTEYRNLLNEYRDGILLFDISNEKVWNRAATDEAGLKAFFEKNRDKYTWEKPKFKSYIIFASNDSVLEAIKAYTDGLTTPVTDREAFTKDMRERFGKDVKVERVIASQGENVITDYLGFNGAKPEPQSQRWPVYIAFQGKVLTAPEEVADVRGAVVADYQQELEAEWIEELRAKYPVKINEKEFNKLKK